MRTITMNMTENGQDPGFRAHAPLFASSWMALLLLLRKEFSNVLPPGSEGRIAGHETPTEDDQGPSVN